METVEVIALVFHKTIPKSPPKLYWTLFYLLLTEQTPENKKEDTIAEYA